MPDLLGSTTMDLLLWRHAEAEDGEDDLKRRLTARGEKQARTMAAWIRDHQPIPQPAELCDQDCALLDAIERGACCQQQPRNDLDRQEAQTRTIGRPRPRGEH